MGSGCGRDIRSCRTEGRVELETDASLRLNKGAERKKSGHDRPGHSVVETLVLEAQLTSALQGCSTVLADLPSSNNNLPKRFKTKNMRGIVL